MPRHILLAALIALLGLSACSPVVVGAGAAVVADAVVEEEEGGPGGIVGFGQVRPVDGDRAFELASLYVLEGRRGKGIGRELVKRLVRRTKEELEGGDGFRLYLLSVANSGATSMYTDCGFKICSSNDLPGTLRAEAVLGSVVLALTGRQIVAMKLELKGE